jgi:hypothetical protein
LSAEELRAVEVGLTAVTGPIGTQRIALAQISEVEALDETQGLRNAWNNGGHAEEAGDIGR